MAVVTFANGKGGVGKSANVFNVHEPLGASLVIDGDVHRGISDLNSFRSPPLKCFVAPNNVDEMLALIEQDNHDSIIIIDCGGYDDDMSRVAIANADMLIVPSNDNVQEEVALLKMSRSLAQISASVGREIVGHVLLNRVHPSRTKFAPFDSMLDRIDNLVRLPVTIPMSKEFDEAMRDGMAVKSGTLPVKYFHLARHIKAHLVAIGALNHE